MHEQFFSRLFVQLQAMVLVIDSGQAGIEDVTGTSFPAFRAHLYSSYVGIWGLLMWALLSTAVANADHLRWWKKAFSVCGSNFSRVDLLFRNLWALSLLTLWTPSNFCQTPVGTDLIFSILLLGTGLIFAKLPLVPDVFSSLKNVATPHELSYL